MSLKTKRCAVRMAVVVLVATVMACLPLSSQAESGPVESRLAAIFQDNMVLQREKPVPVWGWAKPGTLVEVSFGGQKKQATADEHGYWKAVLEPMKANREGQELAVKIGGTVISRKNVLVGEVWITASHSALGSPGLDLDSGYYPHYDFSASGGGKPEVRFCEFGFGASLVPYDDVDPMGHTWWKTLPENPPANLMDAAEFFARVVRDGVKVPVGIVRLLLVTGTGNPTWCARETLESFPAADGHGKYYQEFLARQNAMLANPVFKYHSFDEFKKLEDAWRTTKTGRWPGDIALNIFPGMGYNTRVYPLHPFAVRGALFWAIGGGDHGVCAPLDVAMQKQWRELFGQPEMYFIEMANCRYTTDQPPLTPCLTTNWTSDAGETTRKAGLLYKDDKRAALVDLWDTGGWATHLLNKAEQGRRMGQAALTLAYGQNYNYTGPRMLEAKIAGNKATVRFDHVGDGIIYQPSIDGISGVYLVGKSGPAQWAQVKIVGKDTAEFSSPAIAEVAGVAFGENTNPHETLFNSEGGKVGLPASPFSTIPISGGTAPKFEIVTQVGEGRFHILNNDVIKDARVSLVHVRRSGYVFLIVGEEKLNNAMQPIPDKPGEQVRKSTTVLIKAYVPAEWKEVEVVTGNKYDISFYGGFPRTKGLVGTGGKALKIITDTTKDGARFITFNAPVDLTWVIVAEKGKTDEFRKINRY